MSACCDAPTLVFDWKLGINNADSGVFLLVNAIHCSKCGRTYSVMNNEGELQKEMIIDLYLEKTETIQ